MAKPAVEDRRPPLRVVRLLNPVVRAILRSPLHRLAGRDLMLLTVTGRRSGRTYSIPVTRYEREPGAFILSAGGAWRHNLRDGADVRVTIDGVEHAAHAELERDPDRATAMFKALLDAKGARAVGMRVNLDRAPTAEEIKPALAGRGVGYLRLTD